MNEITEPLKNGTKLPDHPADTTARKITKYGEVKDAHDGTILTAGLHESEIQTLMHGMNHAIAHLYRYAIKNGYIFHTRPRVVIEVETMEVEDV